MKWLALMLVLGDHHGRFERFCSRTDQGRTERGFLCGGAAFEAFGPNGAGTFGVCSTTAPTGSKGEPLTFVRATSATCQRTAGGGAATTGIANGDLVILASNQGRVEYEAGGGALGIRFEPAATNDAIRGRELCNAAWTDVGTPACASDAATGPFGAATMDTITDNDAVAFEGRAQAIASTSATFHTVSCYVKSVSGATAASITMVGTGSAAGDCTGTATGLSTTTSTRVFCISPAAYAGTLTSVAVTVRVGTVVADQGTVAVEGCQHETWDATYGYLTSYIDTTSAAATRNADTWQFNALGVVGLTVTSGSSAFTLTPLASTSETGGAAVAMSYVAQAGVAEGRSAYTPLGNQLRAFDGTNEPIATPVNYIRNVLKRIYTTWGSGTLLVRDDTDAVQASGAFDGSWGGAGSQLLIGSGGGSIGIMTRLCYDPNAARCR